MEKLGHRVKGLEWDTRKLSVRLCPYLALCRAVLDWEGDKVTELFETEKISVLGSSLSLCASYVAKYAISVESFLENP